MLVDGGELLDSVAPGELAGATEYLFNELVSTGEVHAIQERESAKLKIATDDAVVASGISKRADFKNRPSIWFKHYGVVQYTNVDYAIGPISKPHTIYQRFVLNHQAAFDRTILHFDLYRNLSQSIFPMRDRLDRII